MIGFQLFVNRDDVFDDVQGRDIADRLMAVQADYPKALAYLKAAMEKVRQRQRDSMSVVRKSLA